MRTFVLYREEDVSGVSGTGIVAEGVKFSDGKVVIRWRGERSSTVVWDSIEDAVAIHGHNGATKILWLDDTNIDLSDLGLSILKELYNAAAHFIESAYSTEHRQSAQDALLMVMKRSTIFMSVLDK